MMSDEKKPMRYKPSRLIIGELTGDIMLAREVDKYYDILLAEKDKKIADEEHEINVQAKHIIKQNNEIERLHGKITEFENLFAIQQTRMDKATKLWQEATGKTETLPDLGDLLNWLMEQSTEAKRVHREMIDLLEVITEESNETYPEMAATDAVRLLKREKEEAERSAQFWEGEARRYCSNSEHWGYKADETERKIKEEERLSNARRNTIKYLIADLKTATDALKVIANIKYEYAPCYLFIEDAKRALADIEGEKNLVQNPDDLTTSDWHELEIKEPDWKTIEADAKGESIEMSAGSYYQYQAKAILYLRDKLSKLEGTLSETRSEIIEIKRKENE